MVNYRLAYSHPYLLNNGREILCETIILVQSVGCGRPVSARVS